MDCIFKNMFKVCDPVLCHSCLSPSPACCSGLQVSISLTQKLCMGGACIKWAHTSVFPLDLGVNIAILLKMLI